ncbi:hypothetical protein BGW38_004314 [Lunasporangiospora selenospora]|uniref:Uncharacterized protein n=1 Tax=Lunasporangiospora selenospora TaxID=979761 RepID=A0A9P6FQB6_9FUNG|nr:hypothetical protein BGW38_004314 [Lunasporangiospora selenospora]
MTSDSHEPRLPIATVSTNSRGALPDVFHCSVHVVDLARASLSRRFESVQCLLARDDTASVNLYLDQRKELDYLSFRLTRNIRQLYTNGPTHTVKVQLSSQQQRLDITLATGTLCQAIYDQLQQDEPTADEYEHFPMIRPKVGLLKPDPTAAYLTASDMPVDSKELVISSAPKRKQIVVQSSRPEPDQSNKKSRIYPIPGRSTYRPSREAVDPILSSEICDYDDSSELWTLASSPPDPHHEEMLTRSLSATRRPLDRSEGSGYSRPNAGKSREIILLGVVVKNPIFGH